MNTYVSKNYHDKQGDVLHIGGALEFGDEAKVENFPGAVNQAASTASDVSGIVADFNALLIKLKNAGIVQPDDFTVTVANTVNDQAEAHADRSYNTSKISSVEVGADNVITITLSDKVENLKDFDGGGSWGVFKWLGIAVSAGITPITGLKFNGAQLTAEDVSEATAVGLSAGQFVLWVKAERILEGESNKFTLSADGYKDTVYTLFIVEPVDGE